MVIQTPVLPHNWEINKRQSWSVKNPAIKKTLFEKQKPVMIVKKNNNGTKDI